MKTNAEDRVNLNPDPVVASLTAIRDAGLVADRDALNRAWSELTGRAVPASGDRCQTAGCQEPGHPFREPAGVWCREHVPILWRTPEARWAVPACHACGAPAAYPNRRNEITRPACRDHAPPWIRRYLAAPERVKSNSSHLGTVPPIVPRSRGNVPGTGKATVLF